MTLGKTINKIRTESSLSQEQFATIIGVSQQSVQKWESDASVPELEKIIKIAKYFGVSLDSLVLGNDLRVVEERDNYIEWLIKYKESEGVILDRALLKE